ncbi:TfoX/Sxy family DNA transformation protein [Leptospira sp. 201903070]|uniref:TfoX/Sxy family DNA transformation protein n=1 Tax=Leptospira ainlahdjerensis TaxID=2810033 RepID=A0ABS2U8A5_9LEPT|nr:TfoX/Sxy family DNA transformation protein [Leptospira ainlahdjerensis]MBM9576607.1 TfoX/Sxy family DNA transformation protein [Leptospira ainlahdjerensis]
MNRKISNLGKTILSRLKKAGIKNLEELKRLGSVKGYLRIQSLEYKRLPFCYYLYSLEGAILGKSWREIEEDRKRELRQKVTKSREQKRIQQTLPGLGSHTKENRRADRT